MLTFGSSFFPVEEEINNMKIELEKYGIQMPAFSKIGGILANELSVDEAACKKRVISWVQAELLLLLSMINTIMVVLDMRHFASRCLVAQTVKRESACNAGDPSSIPGSGRSPGEGNGNPLQYSCLENPYGQKSLVGYCPWSCKESDMTEQLTLLSLGQ